jgi:hypothetical protein
LRKGASGSYGIRSPFATTYVFVRIAVSESPLR